MKPSLLLASAFVLIAYAGPLFAQDVFVRPTNPAPATPDLGVAPKPVQPKPIEKPVEPTPIEQAQPAPQPVTPPTDYTPPPSTGGGTSVDRISDTVQIIKVDSKPAPNPQGNGGNSLSISIQPGGIGNYDKSVVSSQLGLSDSEIQSNCYLEYQSLLSFGGNGGEMLNLGNGNRVNYRFSGGLENVDIYTTIACRKVKRPVAGMIIEEGGYYKVGATPASCKAGGKQGGVSLTFKYLGDGQAACQFN